MCRSGVECPCDAIPLARPPCPPPATSHRVQPPRCGGGLPAALAATTQLLPPGSLNITGACAFADADLVARPVRAQAGRPDPQPPSGHARAVCGPSQSGAGPGCPQRSRCKQAGQTRCGPQASEVARTRKRYRESRHEGANQPTASRQRMARQMDPTTGRLQRFLDQAANVPVVEDGGRQLRSATPGDEHPASLVNPGQEVSAPKRLRGIPTSLNNPPGLLGSTTE